MFFLQLIENKKFSFSYFSEKIKPINENLIQTLNREKKYKVKKNILRNTTK